MSSSGFNIPCAGVLSVAGFFALRDTVPGRSKRDFLLKTGEKHADYPMGWAELAQQWNGKVDPPYVPDSQECHRYEGSGGPVTAFLQQWNGW